MDSLTYPTQPGAAEKTARPALARAAARLSAASAALFLVLLAGLHVLKPGLDPAWRMVSEYALGDYGWLMRLAFFVLALSCAALVVAVRTHAATLGGKLGLAALLAAAAAMVAAGLFAIDPVTAGPGDLTAHGQLHGLAAMIGNPAFALAAVLVSLSLARHPAWAPARRALLWTAQLPWISLVAMFATLFITLGQTGGVFGPEVVVGWPNRVLLAAYCLWLATAARHVIRMTAPEA